MEVFLQTENRSRRIDVCRHNEHAVARAFTLVELLVTIAIVTVLITMLIPAVHIARESARMTKCSSNLREFGISLNAHAANNRGELCSGAFDWRRDGPVTEVGWVADATKSGVPAGQMLCPSNVAQYSLTLEDLIAADKDSLGNCVDHLGSFGRKQPDGTTLTNPCRKILSTPLEPRSVERQSVIVTEILEENYNTNYTASWILVRSRPLVDARNGNVISRQKGCPADLKGRNSTAGPLNLRLIDASPVSSALIPILGDGAVAGTLSSDIGQVFAGSELVAPFTAGPKLATTFEPPEFADTAVRDGENGWWRVWNEKTIQDYRGFAPVHRGRCNVLMADGSVKNFSDQNGDGFLNNGFVELSADPSSRVVEIPSQVIFNGASLVGI